MKSIREWSWPQSSAHFPSYVPIFFGVISNELRLPGMTSSLNRNAGTQNEWMTSSESRVNRTDSPCGRTSVGGLPGVPVTVAAGPPSLV